MGASRISSYTRSSSRRDGLDLYRPEAIRAVRTDRRDCRRNHRFESRLWAICSPIRRVRLIRPVSVAALFVLMAISMALNEVISFSERRSFRWTKAYIVRSDLFPAKSNRSPELKGRSGRLGSTIEDCRSSMSAHGLSRSIATRSTRTMSIKSSACLQKMVCGSGPAIHH